MSKFAVLKVEGLSSSDEDSDTNNKCKKPSGNAGSGKSKKKKQQQQQGHPVPAARSHKPSQQQQQQQPSKKKQQTTDSVAVKQDSALEEWQRKDQELVESSYQRELAQAIMASRLEQQANSTAASLPSAAAVPGSTLARMEAESRRAADAAVRREKLSEKELIRHQVEQELQAKFQAVLAEKDAEAVALRADADNLKRALAASEAQVSHLNSLLSLVEGKKAKGLSEQIYQLTAVITELTDSTKALDSELAKEKTRCHQLQEQVDRLRSGGAAR